MLGNEERLVRITGASEAYATKPRTFIVILMLDAGEAELIFEEVFQMPCKASGG